MPRFVALTSKAGGRPIFVNPETVETVGEHQGACTVSFIGGNDDYISVLEPIEEVVRLLSGQAPASDDAYDETQRLHAAIKDISAQLEGVPIPFGAARQLSDLVQSIAPKEATPDA